MPLDLGFFNDARINLSLPWIYSYSIVLYFIWSPEEWFFWNVFDWQRSSLCCKLKTDVYWLRQTGSIKVRVLRIHKIVNRFTVCLWKKWIEVHLMLTWVTLFLDRCPYSVSTKWPYYILLYIAIFFIKLLRVHELILKTCSLIFSGMLNLCFHSSLIYYMYP